MKRTKLSVTILVLSALNVTVWLPLAECFFFHAALIPFIVAIIISTVGLKWSIDEARWLVRTNA